jgi:prepilin-type N-terminal cleavage/methylation domain-containing protein
MPLFPLICLNKKKKKNSGAFTLVELLIAVSIFSVVSIAIYSVFSSGTAILRRVKNIDLAQQKILLKTESLARQLRQQPACRKQLFLGAETKISFPSNVDSFPSRVTYYFDEDLSCLMRVIDRLDKIITPEGKLDSQLKAKPSVFLNKVKEVKLSYLYLDTKKNEYNWADEWKENYLPVAVRFMINVEGREYAATTFLLG